MDYKFVGRQKEINLLNGLYQRESGQLLVLYGRRRIGKTYLVRHWLDQLPEPQTHLYWVATQTSTVRQLRDFSQTLLRFTNPNIPIPADFSYQSWETAFLQVAQIAESKRFVLVLDEFTYVMQSNPELASILQRVWDHHFKQGNLFLILTGSLVGIIERTTLDYKAPLYGRATARLKLHPLPFGALSTLFPRMTTEQRVAIYAMVGGIPAYLTLFSDRLNIRQNIEACLVNPTNVMATDAVFLLKEQFDDPRNYTAIIDAIANGAHRLTEIAKMAGLQSNHVTGYLRVLQDLGYIERLVPATVKRPEQSKKGRYVITDPYLRFYFRFLRPYMADIEYGRLRPVLDLLETHLVDFIGSFTFEELCREWVKIKVDLGEFRFLADRVGSFWSREAQCDVVALNWRSKTIFLGECKWGLSEQKAAFVDKLVNLKEKVVPKTNEWQIYFGLFTRKPLSAAAQKRVTEIDGLVVSPEMIEADFIRWMDA